MWILVGLVPAIAWGIQPIVITKIGGRPVNQIIGTTFGTFFISAIVLITMFGVGTPSAQLFNPVIFWTSFASGVGWCIGQILQYTAFKILGVAKAMPLSTGLQLILINVISVIAFHDWLSPYQQAIVGFVAVALIIVGVFCIAYKQKIPQPGFVPEKTKRPKVKLWAIVLIFAIGTIGYIGYFLLGELPHHIDFNNPFDDNSETQYGFAQFFPQASGMVVISIFFAFFMWFKPCFGKHKISVSKANQNCPFKQYQSYFNMVDGIIFSAAALTILLSKAHNGPATATSLSQTNIIIATLGGLFILKEHKPTKELILTLTGLALVVTGGILIGCLEVMFPNKDKNTSAAIQQSVINKVLIN